jgi:hypothetical protein
MKKLKLMLFVFPFCCTILVSQAQVTFSQLDFPVTGEEVTLETEGKDSLLVNFFGLARIIDTLSSVPPNNITPNNTRVALPPDSNLITLFSDYTSFQFITYTNENTGQVFSENVPESKVFDTSHLPSGAIYRVEIAGPSHIVLFHLAKP